MYSPWRNGMPASIVILFLLGLSCSSEDARTLTATPRTLVDTENALVVVYDIAIPAYGYGAEVAYHHDFKGAGGGRIGVGIQNDSNEGYWHAELLLSANIIMTKKDCPGTVFLVNQLDYKGSRSTSTLTHQLPEDSELDELFDIPLDSIVVGSNGDVPLGSVTGNPMFLRVNRIEKNPIEQLLASRPSAREKLSSRSE